MSMLAELCVKVTSCEGGTLKSVCSPCREMWEYLEHVALFLTNIGQVLKTLPSSEKNLVRKGLSTAASRRYSSSQLSRKKARTPRTESRAIPFITGENGQLLPGRSNRWIRL